MTSVAAKIGLAASERNNPVPTIADFVRGFSLEATRPSTEEIAALADTAEAGTRVYVSAVSTRPPQEVLEQAWALRKALLGSDHRDTVDCRNELAKAYRYADRPEEADRLYDQKPDSPSRAAELAIDGAQMLSQKKPVEAELRLRECLNIRQAKEPVEGDRIFAHMGMTVQVDVRSGCGQV